ncbi:MAG TPA: hypothetical protein VGH42_13845 [Verrucomicrobiae bacterium]|jgi:hypothetical protein
MKLWWLKNHRPQRVQRAPPKRPAQRILIPLRAIRDLIKSVAEESGGADLAAIESEIETLDTEIDTRVYELYGLTEDEIKIVERAGK